MAKYLNGRIDFILEYNRIAHHHLSIRPIKVGMDHLSIWILTPLRGLKTLKQFSSSKKLSFKAGQLLNFYGIQNARCIHCMSHSHNKSECYRKDRASTKKHLAWTYPCIA